MCHPGGVCTNVTLVCFFFAYCFFLVLTGFGSGLLFLGFGSVCYVKASGPLMSWATIHTLERQGRIVFVKQAWHHPPPTPPLPTLPMTLSHKQTAEKVPSIIICSLDTEWIAKFPYLDQVVSICTNKRVNCRLRDLKETHKLDLGCHEIIISYVVCCFSAFTVSVLPVSGLHKAVSVTDGPWQFADPQSPQGNRPVFGVFQLRWTATLLGHCHAAVT